MVEAVPLKQRGTNACKPKPISSASSAGPAVAYTMTSASKPSSTLPAIVNKVSQPMSYSTSKTTSYTSSAASTKYTSPPTSSPASSPSSLLFPFSTGSSHWSCSPSVPNSLPLSDATFHTTSNLGALSHNTVKAPDGQQSLQAIYPKGSAALSGASAPIGGFSFYAPGPTDLSKAKEVTLAYSVLFPDGFDFNLGGKLPGLYGGDTTQGAISCSGGRRDKTCWSARFMWRTGGAGELYTYLPPIADFPANQAQCSVAPLSDCNDVYGASVGRGSWKFVPGQRSTISQRVLLNDVGQSNGEIEVLHNGKTVINLKGVVIRDANEGVFRGIQMQTFFGGHDSNPWGSPKEQSSYFSDFSLAVTKTFY